MPHIHEKVDLTVEVLIVHSGKVLLRKHDKYKIWLGVGGHVELHEDPNQAAIREVKEEVGLDIVLEGEAHGSPEKDFTELIPPRFLNRHRINDTHEHVCLVYFATTSKDAISQGGREMSDEIKWFTKEELDDSRYGIRENIKRYARKALEVLG